MQLIKVTTDIGPTYVNADLVLWVQAGPGGTHIGLAGQKAEGAGGGIVIVKGREPVEDVVRAMGGCTEVG